MIQFWSNMNDDQPGDLLQICSKTYWSPSMTDRTEPPQSLIDLNTALVSAKDKATDARAKLEGLTSRGTSGHGAAQGGGETGQRRATKGEAHCAPPSVE